jgi:hypothetical protein
MNAGMRFGALSALALLGVSAMAQVNVAAAANGSSATQSSIWAGSPAAFASLVTDENRNGLWNANGVLTLNHTGIEQGAWLRVSFAGAFPIDSVNLWNRTDGFGNRLNPFSVRLFNGGSEVWSQTAQAFTDTIDDGLSSTAGMSFAPAGVMADMIEVQLDGTNYLHLAEVEAYSPVPEPGIMAAVGLGAAALLRRRRRSA